jgi:hypothetical protein
MSVMNLNGVSRKNAAPIKGQLNRNVFSAAQHATIGFPGKTYNSPFTDSAIPPLNDSHNNSTQPFIPALKSETSLKVVKLHKFNKVHPGLTTATVKQSAPASRPNVMRTGGPSQHADTPANPDARAKSASNTPKPKTIASHKDSTLLSPGDSIGNSTVHGSFLSSSRTLSSKSNHDTVSAGRWETVK